MNQPDEIQLKCCTECGMKNRADQTECRVCQGTKFRPLQHSPRMEQLEVDQAASNQGISIPNEPAYKASHTAIHETKNPDEVITNDQLEANTHAETSPAKSEDQSTIPIFIKILFFFLVLSFFLPGMPSLITPALTFLLIVKRFSRGSEKQGPKDILLGLAKSLFVSILLSIAIMAAFLIICTAII